MNHPTLSRRDFASSATGAAALAFAQKPASANDRMLRTGQVDVVAIADPYEPHLDEALGTTNGKAQGFKDFRHVLDRQDIDAVCIATPDHWHAIPMIMACEAGKDVYVENSVSHTLHEGRRMVEAAQKHGRIVLSSGKLGKGMRPDTWINWNRTVKGLGNPPDTDPPHWLDWDLCLGPAPMRSYNRNRCIANFRWFWDYSTGMITDWGVHLIDVVHWAMGVDAPRTVNFAGGTPQSPVRAKESIVTFQSRFVNSHHDTGHSHDIEFGDRGGYTFYPEPDRSHGEAVAQSAIQHGGSAQHYPHVLNFLECVRTRQKPRSDIDTMHRSTSAPLLGAIACKVGRKLNWDAQQERFTGDEEANRHLTKEYRKPWNVA